MLFHTGAWMELLLHPGVVFVMPIVWVCCVYLMAGYMTTRKAFEVKRAMQVYNVVQIVVCSYMVWGLTPVLGFPNLFGIDTAFDRQGEWFIFVHYLTKFLDWFDTLWILMKRNRGQLSFLHVYHHATIGMIWGFLLRNNVAGGTTRYGAWANSLTHVVMYSHYLWTSFGLKNPFKRYITLWQICQFWSCLAHAICVFSLETSSVQKFSWLQVVYQLTMIYLFTLKLHWVPAWTPHFGKSDLKEMANSGRTDSTSNGKSDRKID